jgi:hypothetical protein
MVEFNYFSYGFLCVPRLPAVVVSQVHGSLTFPPVEVIFACRAVAAESTHAVSSVKCETGWLARAAAVVSRAGVA